MGFRGSRVQIPPSRLFGNRVRTILRPRGGHWQPLGLFDMHVSYALATTRSVHSRSRCQQKPVPPTVPERHVPTEFRGRRALRKRGELIASHDGRNRRLVATLCVALSGNSRWPEDRCGVCQIFTRRLGSRGVTPNGRLLPSSRWPKSRSSRALVWQMRASPDTCSSLVDGAQSGTYR